MSSQSLRNRGWSVASSSAFSAGSVTGSPPPPTSPPSSTSPPSPSSPLSSPTTKPTPMSPIPEKKVTSKKVTLSSFGQRLLDPKYLSSRAANILTPTIDPLNDTFLKTFGESITSRGDDNKNDDDKEDDLESINSDDDEEQVVGDKTAGTAKCRLRISNLSFQTTATKLEAVVARYGEYTDFTLLPSSVANHANSGRAYVTLLNAASAEAFKEATKSKEPLTVDGRTITVEDATAVDSKPRHGSLGLRYYSTDGDDCGDIGMKCFNCDKVGHLARDCKAPMKVQPCNACGAENNHVNPRGGGLPPRCPLLMTCFSCHTPGHETKNCPARGANGNQRNQRISRLICTTCGRNDHHRVQCRARPWEVKNPLMNCVACGEVGHGCCDGKGNDADIYIHTEGPAHATNGNAQGTCGNCGGDNHWGFACRRVGMDMIMRSPDMINAAICEEVVAGTERLVRRKALKQPKVVGKNRPAVVANANASGMPPQAGGGKNGGNVGNNGKGGNDGKGGNNGKGDNNSNNKRSVPPQKNANKRFKY